MCDYVVAFVGRQYLNRGDEEAMAAALMGRALTNALGITVDVEFQDEHEIHVVPGMREVGPGRPLVTNADVAHLIPEASRVIESGAWRRARSEI